MKFTIEMNIYELSRSIQAGTLEALVEDIKEHEDEVRSNRKTAVVPKTTSSTPETKDPVTQNNPAVEEQVKDTEPEVAEERSSTSITLEDVRAAFIAKNSKANTAKLKALLNDFGVKKVTDLKESDFPKVIEALEAI